MSLFRTGSSTTKYVSLVKLGVLAEKQLVYSTPMKVLLWVCNLQNLLLNKEQREGLVIHLNWRKPIKLGNVVIVRLKENNFEVEAWKCNGEKSYPEEKSAGSVLYANYGAISIFWNDFQCHRLISDVVACELCYFNRFRIWIEVFASALAFEGHKSGQYRQGLPFGDYEDVRRVRVLLRCTFCLHAGIVVRFLAE